MNPKPATATPPATNDAFRIEEDGSSGRLHKRYADEFGVFRLTDERCNRAKSGSYAILKEVAVDRDLSDFCAYDFPRDDADVPIDVDPARDPEPGPDVDGDDVGA